MDLPGTESGIARKARAKTFFLSAVASPLGEVPAARPMIRGLGISIVGVKRQMNHSSRNHEFVAPLYRNKHMIN